MWLAERMEPDQFRMFDTMLNVPPADAAPEVVEMTAEEEGRAFIAFQAALGGGDGRG
jgi:hypothetical protein